MGGWFQQSIKGHLRGRQWIALRLRFVRLKRVCAGWQRALQEERYADAARLRDETAADLVGTGQLAWGFGECDRWSWESRSWLLKLDREKEAHRDS